MKNSERIGYVLEHLIAIELEKRGVVVGRSERMNNESIKCDLTFSYKNKSYVVFVTHTRTQGMTNRKFYRTFEELAQRRGFTPDSICIEVSLVRGASGVREQQDIIMEQMFDYSLAVLPKTLEALFIETVKELPAKISLDVTRSCLEMFPANINKHISELVDDILAAVAKQKDPLSNFWRLESKIRRGRIVMSPNSGISIKLGMKMLSLMDPTVVKCPQVASGVALLPRETAAHVERLSALGIVTAFKPTLRGIRAEFSKHSIAAAKFLSDNKMELEDGWHTPYLKTPGAQRLHDDLSNPVALARRNAELYAQLKGCSNIRDLEIVLADDYLTDEPRCDLLDLALRASGYTQNQISVDIVAASDHSQKMSDSIGFLIRKSENLDSVIGDVRGYIATVARLIWDKSGGSFKSISDADFFSSRAQTYYANAYVCPELFLLDRIIKNWRIAGKCRLSVLPRLCNLPPRFRMAVNPAAYRQTPKGNEVFIVTISTPEERHHKHKEFAGKLRAIRYTIDQEELKRDKVEYLCIIDGHWTTDQIGMLANAGWSVYDWENGIGHISGFE